MSDGVEIPISIPGGPEGAAVLRAIADAMKGVGDETTTAGVKAEAVKSAFSFNEVRQAVTSLAHDVTALVRSMADLASEQSRLDANSTRLGLDFRAAADAAGKYTDATTTMTASARLAEAGVRLTQEQLNALARVAGNYAATTGQDLNGSIDQLTGALLNGEQEGLRRFGPALAAMGGTAHTAQERLAALVSIARTVPQATDDAADSLRRFEGNLHSAARELSSGFLEELQRLERESNRAAGIVGTDSDSITNHWREVGETGAAVFHTLANSINLVAEAMAHTVYTAGRLLTAITEIREHPLSIGDIIGRFDADVRASSARLVGAARALVGGGGEGGAAESGGRGPLAGSVEGGGRRFGRGNEEESGESARASFSADESAQTLKGNISRRMAMGGAAEERMKSAKADQLAAERAIAEAYNAEHEALQRLRETETREADARDALHRAELDRLTDRLRAQQEREKAESVEGARAIRETERLHREQQRRLDMTQTYTERMRDLRAEEISSIQELAETTNMAFRTTGEALTTHLQAFADGEETAAEAAQNMLADTLKNIGKEALVKAGFFFAEGLGNLAIFNFPGAATAFAASAAYAAVGGGLVAGGNALTDTNTLGQRKDAENRGHHGGGGAGTESAARLSKGGASGGDGGTVYNVMFGGPMYGTGGVRQAARQLGGVLNRGAVQGGVQLLPGVLMGGGAGS